MNEELLKIKDKAKLLLKELEGLYLKPKKCPAGKWTIGHGHNLEANRLTAEEARRAEINEDFVPAGVVDRWRRTGIGVMEMKMAMFKYAKGITITAETADYILDNDVCNFITQLMRYEYLDEAPENVKIALICICFQCGFRGLNENIFVEVNPHLTKHGYRMNKKIYFIDHIIKKDYEGAIKILKAAKIFAGTRRRAHIMADLIEKEICKEKENGTRSTV